MLMMGGVWRAINVQSLIKSKAKVWKVLLVIINLIQKKMIHILGKLCLVQSKFQGLVNTVNWVTGLKKREQIKTYLQRTREWLCLTN